MRNTNIYRFLPNIGIQNINIRKLNDNFEALNSDIIHFKLNESGTISTGSKGLVYIPSDISITGWIAGTYNDAILTADVRKCSMQSYPETLSITGNSKITLESIKLRESSELSDWDVFVERGSWLELFVENISGTNQADIVIKFKR